MNKDGNGILLLDIIEQMVYQIIEYIQALCKLSQLIFAENQDKKQVSILTP